MSDDDAPVFHVGRVNRNRLTINYQSVAAKAIGLALQRVNESGWSKEEELDGLLIESKVDQATKLKVIRGTLRINSAASEIFEVLKDLNRMKEWHPKVTDVRLVSRVSETHGLSIVQFQLEGSFFADPRDFVVLRGSKTEDSVSVLASVSVIHPSATSSSSVVRATAHEMAFVVEANSEDSSTVTYITHLDMNASTLSNLFVPTEFPKALLTLKKLLK
eukprot:c1484_g1_i1.p1 GENE.c1484_g1_i1~~c1484_g1_i1.p1  ORF type:complete len:233 (-),score=53.22 c1484_g1_i1:11-664(-)